jgi:hypothetical protein
MKKFAGYLLVAIHALILLFLIFQEQVVFPAWIQSFGRVHPLFLHIPIGVIVVVIVLVFFVQRLAKRKLVKALLLFTAVTAALTALMGIVLGTEEGYDSALLNGHRIAGVITSVIAWGTYVVHSSYPKKEIYKIGALATMFVLLVAGHLGSVITHGDQFVLAPILGSEENRLVVDDSTSLFRAAVYPVLESKCASCHNDNKRKGKLSMETMASLMEGGDGGVLWHRGEPGKSLLINRILLPEDHKEHMPPDGKPQLTVTEVNLLYHWVLSGADTALAWTRYSKSDTVRKLAERLIHTGKKAGPLYHFDPADEETVASLNDPFRTVNLIARDEPALAATFYIRNQFQSDRLNDLLKVKEQLVDLNLDGMPITDDDCETLSKFTNLEKLNLNFSSIGPGCLQSLATLQHLKSLAIAGTKLDDAALLQFRDFPSLEKVYIWNTSVADPAALMAKIPNVAVDLGEPGSESSVLRLSPPMLSTDNFVVGSGDSVTLWHKLPDVIIRYTLDGTEPDSTSSAVFKTPMRFDACTEVNAVACKPGWYCSESRRFLVFKKGKEPATVTLNTKANKDYRFAAPRALIDNKKGFADNYYRDPAWFGHRDEPFDATFSFDESTTVNEVVISYARNIPSFLFPPALVEVWAGDTKDNLKLIRQVQIPEPTEAGHTQIEALRVPLDQAQFSNYRVVARPFPTLPKWHPANTKETKDKRTWVFVDEVFFN